jgi:RNA polymerase sigma-70 factor (ECF subfamily)
MYAIAAGAEIRIPVMTATPDSEADLVRRARRGEVDAFEDLYRRHVGRIYAVSLRMVADPSLAEELTQEAFVRAWGKLASFHGTSAFGTWLHRLAVNVVLDALRARRRWRERFSEEPPARPPAAPTRDLAGTVDLERCIALLPPRARAVFVLHDVEGYKHREIAALLDLSVGACKAHLHRARRRLREELDR